MELNGFSIIVPTFREAKNIAELVHRVGQIDFAGMPFELLIVDDNSDDNIVEVVQKLRAQHPWLRLMVRQGVRSLSLSVLDGFEQAIYPTLFVMDADLSHPPEKIPVMGAALTEADFVIGSRYVANGSTDEIWPVLRKMTSWAAAQLAKIVLSSHVKDPLSGFLGLRKSTYLAGDTLDPIGWKIGLELMIKCRCKKIIEVPIHFSQRHQGASKLNFKVALHYLQHIKRLAVYKFDKAGWFSSSDNRAIAGKNE